jgi:hypothetical protein
MRQSGGKADKPEASKHGPSRRAKRSRR